MQKRHSNESLINYYKINLPQEFPVVSFSHIQKYQAFDYLHYHDGIEIGICDSGNGIFFSGNQISAFSEGDVSIIFAYMPHIAQSLDNFPSYWRFMTFEPESLFYDMGIVNRQPLLDLLINSYGIPTIISPKDHSDVVYLITQIFNELEIKRVEYQDCVKALLWALLLKIYRLNNMLATDKDAIFIKAGNYEIIAPAIHYISINYNQNMTIYDLSKMCHLSPTGFRRIFKNFMKRSPFEYLYYIRMQMATVFLKATDMSIAEIALQVGYQSLSSFNRHFQKFCNITPTNYRKNLNKLS